MRRLTDRQMLTAARRQLAGHLTTRPASRAEATEIGDRHRAAAETTRATATQIREAAQPALGWGPGPDTISARHAESIEGAHMRREAALLEHHALSADMRADAWASIAAGPEGAAWEATRREYQARVDHYSRLVADRAWGTAVACR